MTKKANELRAEEHGENVECRFEIQQMAHTHTHAQVTEEEEHESDYIH